MPRKILYWFRNDLRLHDHAVLGRLTPGDELLPVFIINPEWFRPLALGFPKMGAYRAQFLLESLADLRRQLQEKGSDLVIRVGEPHAILQTLANEWQSTVLLYQQEDTAEEQAEERAVEAAVPCKVHTWQGQTLIHADELPFALEQLPDVFTAFRKRVEKYSDVREVFPAPTQLPAFPSIDSGPMPKLTDLGLEPATIDDRAAIRFKGGVTAALERLHHYLWEGDHLRAYKETRNGLIGADYSSKLSAWLAMGCLSPRQVYAEVKRYEQERISNSSTYWLIFELLWRDYFRFVAKRYGNRIFQLGGIRGEQPTYHNRPADFEAWRLGESGEPFVDANMKELLLTGFMSNRGRQNVASYLTKDLKIDWRWGAAWMESQLIDYDVCSNWGNWMYVAGVGNDPREDRYFNVRKQAGMYDPEGEYQRLWLEE